MRTRVCPRCERIFYTECKGYKIICPRCKRKPKTSPLKLTTKERRRELKNDRDTKLEIIKRKLGWDNEK